MPVRSFGQSKNQVSIAKCCVTFGHCTERKGRLEVGEQPGSRIAYISTGYCIPQPFDNRIAVLCHRTSHFCGRWTIGDATLFPLAVQAVGSLKPPGNSIAHMITGHPIASKQDGNRVATKTRSSFKAPSSW
eukprot:3586843-Rhodomonas_salina.5